ncbi:MAG: BNR-4 repeat-containing protein [Fibrobacteria bacterium]|nr:BNR-4 repeat-containing protein [Fibrobacteria bacterium]
MFLRSLAVLLALVALSQAQTSTLPVKGWARNSVNVPVFRGNSVATLGQTQYTAFYDGDGKVVVAKRALGSTTWETKATQHSGTVTDAHNTISILPDGDGYLHMSWDMHSSKMRYCKSTTPGGLDMGAESSPVGTLESNTTYPQFFRLPGGDLLFLYRSGSSGNGDLVINRYDLKTRTWKRIHDRLIDGQGARNAYWQAHLDGQGVLHVSWVWRETADVASNHDMCYARSRDGGLTWEKSDGTRYQIPINASTAEYALKIPQNSELINQTSMASDEKSRPYIATYWRDAGSSVPQYRLVYHDGSTWKTTQISRRTTAFSLSGVGTKKIPISRPQLMIDASRDSVAAYMVFRDVERGSKVSLLATTNLAGDRWTVSDLTDTPVDSWEPSFDTDLWNRSRILDLYVQRAGQGDGETSVELEPQPVTILEWIPPTPPTAADRSNSPVRLGVPGNTYDLAGRRVPAAEGISSLATFPPPPPSP